MSDDTKGLALVVGAGAGLSASLARMLDNEGYLIALAARSVADLDDLKAETGASVHSCDVSDPEQVARLFEEVDRLGRHLDVVVFNPSYRTRGPISDLDPEDVRKALMVAGFGGFLVGQQAAKRMLPRGSGTILFTGASASVKGYAGSAPFAMGKFALRGLAQSMARELAPKGIHVAHFVIDGGIRSERRPADPQKPDSLLEPDAIAESYLHILKQPRNAWTWEIELRPSLENF